MSLSEAMASGLLFRLTRYSRPPTLAVPVGSTRFWVARAVVTSCGDSPWALSASGSRSTTICRTLPPAGRGMRTPCTVASMLRTRWLT